MPKARFLLRGSGVLLAASMLARGSMFVFRYIAAVNLTTEQYGQLSLYISLFLSIATFASFGVGGTLSKWAVRKAQSEQSRKILYVNALLLIGCTTLIGFGAFVFALRLNSPQLVIPSILGGAALGLFSWSYLQIFIGFNLADFKFSRVSLYEAGDGLIKLLIMLCFSLLLASVNQKVFIFAFCYGYVVLFLITCFNTPLLFRKPFAGNPIKLVDKLIFTKLATHSSVLMLISLSTLLNGYMLRSFLSRSSATDVAIFDMAITLYSIPKMIFASLVRPVVPYASRMCGQKIPVPNMRLMGTVFVGGMLLLYVFYLSGAMQFFFNKIGLGAYYRSVPIFLLLLMGAPFDLCFGLLSGFFQGAGKVRIVCLVAVGTLTLSLPCSYIAVNLFGREGAAIVNVLFTIILASMTIWVAHREFGFEKTKGQGGALE